MRPTPRGERRRKPPRPLASAITHGGSPLRRNLEQWFHDQGIHPLIAGEFNDSALLKSFAMAGLGAFPAPTAIAEDLEAMYGVKPLCELPVLRQCVYANYAPRRSGHAAVQALLKS